MPELPEVATMIAALLPRIRGAVVRHVLCDPTHLFVNGTAAELGEALNGLAVHRVLRRGKYVRFDFRPPRVGDGRYEALSRAPAPGDSIMVRRPATLEAAREFLGRGERSGPLAPGGATGFLAADRRRRGEDARRARQTPRSLIVHLMMTGRYFVMADNGHPIPPRTRLLVALENRKEDLLFGFKDTRRLGRIDLLPESETGRWPKRLALGPDALDAKYDGAALARRMASRSPIKLALLDQHRLAGLGNIYVTEALHRARIHPERPANSLTPREWQSLAREIPRLLTRSMKRWTEACRWVGPAMEGYGDFRGELRAYGRAGEPCVTCRTPIATLTQSARTTFYCPACQR